MSKKQPTNNALAAIFEASERVNMNTDDNSVLLARLQKSKVTQVPAIKKKQHQCDPNDHSEINKEISIINSPNPESMMSSLELDPRTCFIGNIPVSYLDNKDGFLAFLKTENVLCLKSVESCRFRSIPISTLLTTSGKDPKKIGLSKSMAIKNLKQHKELLDTEKTMNAYLVLDTEVSLEAVFQAVLNRKVELGGHVLRFDTLHGKFSKKHTLFIGNLSFRQANEENLRECLESALGENIMKIRIIRDPKTFVSKGFAFVEFKHELDIKEILAQVEKLTLHDRLLRASRIKKDMNPNTTTRTVNNKNDYYSNKRIPITNKNNLRDLKKNNLALKKKASFKK